MADKKDSKPAPKGDKDDTKSKSGFQPFTKGGKKGK